MTGQGPVADVLTEMLMAYAAQMQQNQAQQGQAHIRVKDVTFHPPGSEQPLLQNINMDIAPNQLGLIIGRSGSGKTTLLQVGFRVAAPCMFRGFRLAAPCMFRV